MRPGEKLFEELLNKNEIHSEQVYEKIYRGKAITISKSELEEVINELFTNKMNQKKN